MADYLITSYRTSMAQPEIRGHLPEGLPLCDGTQCRSRELFPVLQLRETTSIIEGQNPGYGL